MNESRTTEEIITSARNPEVKLLRALHTRKYRRQTGWFLAEGMRHCLQAVDVGFMPVRLVYAHDRKSDAGMDKLIDICHAHKGRVLPVTPALLKKLSRKDNPQTVIAAFDMRYQTLDTVISARQQDIQTHKTECWVALDRIRDPGNLGTIMRTLDAVAARGVILIDECTDPYSVESVRASMGAIFSIDVIQATTAQFTHFVQTCPHQIIGTRLHAPTHYRDITWTHPSILLMGNEQSGLSEGLACLCKDLITLPMQGHSDSLNIAVATGICLYEMMHQTANTGTR